MRLLPSIKQIQDSAVYQKWKNTSRITDEFLTKIAKNVVEHERHRLKSEVDVQKDEVLNNILKRFDKQTKQLLGEALTPVVNATGVILHTNLGRARLAPSAVEAIRQTAQYYTDLEIDLEKGTRGSRYEKIENLLTLITGAEAAMIVNNNAAAVFLILRAFAKNKKVIVSRGELVEIGGSFRVSSIMAESDAKLVEVGTTNKTRIADYEAALTDDTAMLMKVHRSNFTIIGFTEEASRRDLSNVASKHQCIFYEDLGSGAIFNFKEVGIGVEPVISGILKDGVDLVSASGDKLFGGPQAGIILGKKVLIDQLKKHQLARVLRVDKLTLAGVAATLQCYLSTTSVSEIPIVRDATDNLDHIKERAQYLKGLLDKLNGMDIIESETTAYIGGGTMPEVTLKSFGLKIKCHKLPVNKLAYLLRTGEPSVIGRIEDDQLILDCRTVTIEELEMIYKAFEAIFS